MTHPRVLVSVCIDRGPATGVAILTVRRDSSFGARFDLDRRSFGADEPRDTITGSIAERIPRDAAVLWHTRRVDAHALRHSTVSPQLLPSHHLALVARYRPDLTPICLPYGQRELADAATAYGITAERGPLWTGREAQAARDAQALWITFLWACCRPQQRDWMVSAWQAWRALQRARSASF